MPHLPRALFGLDGDRARVGALIRDAVTAEAARSHDYRGFAHAGIIAAVSYVCNGRESGRSVAAHKAQPTKRFCAPDVQGLAHLRGNEHFKVSI